jgi:branched-chain amino acid transport system substrate-binding protein
MIRLPAIGAAVFALALLALPTFAMPAKEGDKLTHLDTRSQLQDVSLAEVKDKKLNILQSFSQQPPSDTSAVCDLKKNPRENQQFVIKA